jgi:hypothetical protein
VAPGLEDKHGLVPPQVPRGTSGLNKRTMDKCGRMR